MSQSRNGRESKDTICVLLIANHQIVQQGFKLLIEASGDCRVGAIRSLDSRFDERDAEISPDVAVVYLNSEDGVEVIAKLAENFPGLPVLVTVSGDKLELQTTALELGAVGIVHEEQSPNLLINAIRKTCAGETWLNQALLDRLVKRTRQKNGTVERRPKGYDPESQVEFLTKREMEVLELIGEGLKNKEIAKSMMISEPTVRCHLSSIYGKLGVDDRLNLVIKAYQLGLLEVTR